jgi:hypothetical protein
VPATLGKCWEHHLVFLSFFLVLGCGSHAFIFFKSDPGLYPCPCCRRRKTHPHSPIKNIQVPNSTKLIIGSGVRKNQLGSSGFSLEKIKVTHYPSNSCFSLQETHPFV